MSATADPLIAARAAEIAARAEAELEALVGISSPSGDVDGAERGAGAVRRAAARPARASSACRARPPGSAPDLVATVHRDRRAAG